MFSLVLRLKPADQQRRPRCNLCLAINHSVPLPDVSWPDVGESRVRTSTGRRPRPHRNNPCLFCPITSPLRRGIYKINPISRSSEPWLQPLILYVVSVCRRNYDYPLTISHSFRVSPYHRRRFSGNCRYVNPAVHSLL